MNGVEPGMMEELLLKLDEGLDQGMTIEQLSEVTRQTLRQWKRDTAQWQKDRQPKTPPTDKWK